MYYLVMQQIATGCDYSIACGQKYVPLEAETLEEAIDEAIDNHYANEYIEGDLQCEEILILKVEEEFDLLEKIQREAEIAEAAAERAEAEEEEKAERKEYERLKAKYETS